jgi:hypothetical protein
VTNPRNRSKPFSQELTVAIPAYNAESSIRLAIESAFDVSPAEVIVVNDGSTDRTASIARDLGCTVIDQINSGAAAARQKCLAATDSRYLILLDADDQLIREGVECSLALATKLVDQGTSFAGVVGPTKTESQTIELWREPVSFQELLRRGISPGPPGAFLWSVACLRQAELSLPAKMNPRYAEDYEFLLRASLHAPIVTHQTHTCFYATTGGKSANSPISSLRSSETTRRYYANFAGTRIAERSDRELQAFAHFRLGFNTDSIAQKAAHYARAIATAPSMAAGMTARRLVATAAARFSTPDRIGG